MGKPDKRRGEAITLHHIHGLGYSNDGRRILIPAHYGIGVYSNGSWETVEGPNHDYMGFSMADNGFYSSGHPAPGSKLKNPLGIVKSTNEGKSIETLGLSGETDFHGMSVSYKTHTIYVLNPAPNSKMNSAGMYYSKDETKTWTRSEMKGVNEELSALAIHPTTDAVVAVGTENGIYVSKDYGQNFAKIVPNIQITSLFFGRKGELYAGGLANNKPFLLEIDVDSKKTEEINIPPLKEDAVTYIAQNPVNENEMVFATVKKDVYLSSDKGESWKWIAEQGKGISTTP
ncbi:F510_1955 family glycosylhydrolase [Effusibacillus consociatus]|uniref:F510_1955 family glycosylhydrolase n=1 Tax=Effusibacillus consociatus TaxID=1117041 RepID=A0ABV9PY02_9BACL